MGGQRFLQIFMSKRSTLLENVHTKELSMTTHQLASAFEALEKTAGRLEMTRLLADLFSQATPFEAEIIAHFALGELCAPYKTVQFNLAEKNVVPAIAHFFAVSASDIMAYAKKKGDLGLVFMDYAWEKEKDLSVEELYDALMELALIAGTGSQEKKGAMLQDLFSCIEPLCAKFVVRIIIGKLRLGFSDMTIIDALSWMLSGDKSHRNDIENAYNICADIGYIARLVKEKGMDGVLAASIELGVPIRPAAAERLPTAQAIFEKLGHCVAQLKLDGFRLQIHVDKRQKEPVVHFFSRNLLDMSFMFPDLKEVVCSLDAQTLIVEGEAICFDQNTGSFLPFQETVKRKRKHGIEEAAQDFPLKIYLFDLLYKNGQSWLDKNHEERRKELIRTVQSVDSDVVQVDEEKVINTAHELEEYFIGAIDKGLEGLVVKRIDAPYKPGKRNFNWIKLKRQEEGHLEDTLDCVVLGYYAGQGKRAAFKIGAFLVGVYNKKEDCFQTVAKVGTGLTDDEWKELKKRCDSFAVLEKPHNVVCAKELAPDVWVSPEIVVLIRADEITISPVHSANKTETELGYALRFPRFMGYRPDKSSYDATTSDEIVHLYCDQKAKLS